jgi:biopolymer transport protein ExbD
MRKQLLILAGLTFLVPGVMLGCSPRETTGEPQAQTQTQTQAQQETGTLQIRANGEEFAREGFVSKDGWKISFNHVYTNLADITAYQSEPPFNPETDKNVQAKEKVVVAQAKTVDLAQSGEGEADSVLVGEVPNAPVGHYNALSWRMVPATAGPAQGQTLVMDGTAEKEGRTVNFVLNIDREFEYVCGEFVGDERKGIVQAGETADLEATFHFDHLFGDADKSPDDPVNQQALGFEPLAALAQNSKLEVDTAQLKSELSAENYQRLQEILPTLGHVGEGHCRETTTQTTALQ